MAGSPEALLWGLLAGVVFPLWLLAGLSDYLCHARTDLAHTSGVHESALHLLQTAEIGIPILAFLFLQPDASVLALMTAGVIAHTWSSWRDLRYADVRRRISPAEQYVHSFLNVLPWLALALVLVLHWPAAVAVFDPAIDADWRLRWRQPPLRTGVLVAVLLSSLVLGVLPGVLEFVHAARARRATAQTSSSSERSATNPR